MWRKMVCTLLVGLLVSACATTRHQPADLDTVLRDMIVEKAREVIRKGLLAWKWPEKKISSGKDKTARLISRFSIITETDKTPQNRVIKEDSYYADAMLKPNLPKISGVKIEILDRSNLKQILREDELRTLLSGQDLEINPKQSSQSGQPLPANFILIGNRYNRGDSRPIQVVMKLVEVPSSIKHSQSTIDLRPTPLSWCQQHTPWCWILGGGLVLVAGTIAVLMSSVDSDSSPTGVRVDAPALP